jgi:outer membrane protein assembly factor BamD (BamD/ComL family)
MYRLLKERNPRGNYSFQISNIYSYLGETENMYKELLSLIISNESYEQTCKNKIRITINEDSENENNILLKKILISEIQKTDSIILNEILIWVFIQEENFLNALKQEISIDKRTKNRDKQIFDLGEISISNSKFNIAKDAFNYIIEKKPQSLYYQKSIINSLEIDYSIFKENPIKNSSNLNKLIKAYENGIDQIGMTNESVLIVRDLAHILAFYNNNSEKAKKLLNTILSKKTYSEQNLAYCKLELGDILLIENDIWDAKLYYSQVEQSFKNDIIGQEAKFKKIKIDYYTGKFNWAQAQLDILKNSTSKLIANNAMELSLLIGDNLNLDTTQIPLQLYAGAELFIFQNNYDNALNNFNTIETIYPSHSLIDNILFHKGIIAIEKGDYELGLSYLDKICVEYYYDILFDDALYKQAYVLEFELENHEKAREKYEELLLKCPSSIFVADARKRYRFLRKLIP